MGIADHLTCLWRNLYAGQEATVRTGHGPTDWFQIGKGVRQGCTAIPKPSQTYVSAGEESAREPTCVRQLLGARRVSIWVCGAADTSQGPWEPGALLAALNLGVQATAGGALLLPFPF